MVKQVKVSELEFESKPTFPLLEHDYVEFIDENLTILEEDKELEEFLKNKEIEIIQTKKGLRIKAGRYIGTAEFTNFILTVNPKFTQLKNIGRLIDYGYNIKDEDIRDFEIKFHEEKNQPMEIIIILFVNLSKKLLRKGLVKSYVVQQTTLPYLRGKLLLQQQIKNDAKFSLNFFCGYDEFTENNLENQIVLYCLDRCYHLTESTERKKSIRKLIHQMDSDVVLKPVFREDIGKIQYTRINYHYKKPHILAELILRHLGVFDFKKQQTSFIVPYFVPMFQVFEDFLTQLFREYYSLPVDDQVATNSWYLDDHPKSIRPDIISYENKRRKKGQEVSIIDAKYMDDIKEGEMYQIAFYLNDYKKKFGYAILPWFKGAKRKVWKAPNQDITIIVNYINIDEILDWVYSVENHEQEISDTLIDFVPEYPTR